MDGLGSVKAGRCVDGKSIIPVKMLHLAANSGAAAPKMRDSALPEERIGAKAPHFCVQSGLPEQFRRVMHCIIDAVTSSRKEDIYYIEVLGKTLDVLDVFAQSDQPQLSLQDISVRTRLNKNTVFRILYTLGEHGYITKENQVYQLGQKLIDLGSSQLHRRDLLTVAGPYLDAMRDQFGETVNLGVIEGGAVRYVDVRESRERFRLVERIGGSDPLHSTALGKAHLAYLPPDEVRALMKQHGMSRQTEHTITSMTALKAELDQVREEGYAVDREESMIGAFCVSAPILNSRGLPVAAISISGPTIRFSADQLPAVSAALKKATAEIRAKLGYSPAS